jgi:MinD-like ATPase involved in chromosome partitioning or flagellar assembly
VLIGLVSAKGSPCVTTAALTFAAVLGIQGLLIELDPSGGTIDCWTGTTDEPGLVRTASALRRSISAESLVYGTGLAPDGVSSILAPTSGVLAESAVAAIGERLSMATADLNRTVILDAGRWARSQTTSRRLSGCDAVLVVCHPTIAGIEAARSIVDALTAAVGCPVALLLNGERPYKDREVSEATGLPIVGTLPWDSRALNDLIITGPSRGWLRTGLARSARSALATVTGEIQAHEGSQA